MSSPDYLREQLLLTLAPILVEAGVNGAERKIEEMVIQATGENVPPNAIPPTPDNMLKVHTHQVILRSKLLKMYVEMIVNEFYPEISHPE